MAAPVDTVSDPVFVLEGCLRERSGGSMTAALRDIWHMAKRKGFAGSYQDAFRFLINSGKYRLMAGIGEPVMVRPLPEPLSPVVHSDLASRLEIPSQSPALTVN